MENLRQAYEHAVAHKGVTYGLHTGVPTDGFIVSMEGLGRVVSAITQESMAEFIRARAVQLDNPMNYFGAWQNPATGWWYYDVSIRVDTLEEARRIAVQNRQLSIYDVAKGEVINLQNR